jgi:hypothetical protein
MVTASISREKDMLPGAFLFRQASPAMNIATIATSIKAMMSSGLSQLNEILQGTF